MFSGCFIARETGQLVSIKGIMKFEGYTKILEENLQLYNNHHGISFEVADLLSRKILIPSK